MAGMVICHSKLYTNFYQGGQEPGRGVYVVRRIVAVLVILLLLILLVPRACEAFIVAGEEPGPGAPETGDDVGDKGETADEIATGLLGNPEA